jgi:hypothetical protein
MYCLAVNFRCYTAASVWQNILGSALHQHNSQANQVLLSQDNGQQSTVHKTIHAILLFTYVAIKFNPSRGQKLVTKVGYNWIPHGHHKGTVFNKLNAAIVILVYARGVQWK